MGSFVSDVPAVYGTAKKEFPAVSVEIVGAPGSATGSADTRGLDVGPVPATFVAETSK